MGKLAAGACENAPGGDAIDATAGTGSIPTLPQLFELDRSLVVGRADDFVGHHVEKSHPGCNSGKFLPLE
jgi:hypothetical protein